MITFDARVIGTAAAVAGLVAAGRTVQAATLQGMARGVQGGISVARGNASGRPGPRNITGDFRRSITGDAGIQRDTVIGWVGSNAAQAARLELGFVGADILGRVYNQPPYPWLLPSVPGVTEMVTTEIASAVRGAL
jgi:hypothetical protein